MSGTGSFPTWPKQLSRKQSGSSYFPNKLFLFCYCCFCIIIFLPLSMKMQIFVEFLRLIIMLFRDEKQGERVEMKQLQLCFYTQDCSELISFMSPLFFYVPVVHQAVIIVVYSFSTALFLFPNSSLQFSQEHCP